MSGDEILNAMDVAPLRFESKHYGPMAYIYPDTNHHFAGWLLRKTANGDWITVRKATDSDVEEMSRAVIAIHHGVHP